MNPNGHTPLPNGSGRRPVSSTPDMQQAHTLITTLRRQSEEIGQSELQRLFNRINLDEQEQRLVVAMSYSLIHQILQQPVLRLQQEAANGNGESYFKVVRHLFALENNLAGY
ncbi:MAG: Glutamyl-tRNA reductase [Anaerolineae bacterium]|nr:Glutamyl-tRNA reductase [Anaerolineae bacterium]